MPVLQTSRHALASGSAHVDPQQPAFESAPLERNAVAFISDSDTVRPVSDRAQISERVPPFARQLEVLRAAPPAQIRRIVRKSIAAPVIGWGAQARVFNVSGFDKLVIRISKTQLDELKQPDLPARDQRAGLHVVPIDFSGKYAPLRVAENCGIARAVIVDAGHPARAAGRLRFTELDGARGLEAEIQNRCFGKTLANRPYMFDAAAIECPRKAAGDANASQAATSATYLLPQALYNDVLEQTRAALRGFPRSRLHLTRRNVGAQLAVAESVFSPKRTLRFGCIPIRAAAKNPAQALHETVRNEAREEYRANVDRFCESYGSYVQEIAALPQQAFNAFMRTVQHVEQAGGTLDLTHCANLMLDEERERITIVDVGFRERLVPPHATRLEDLLQALLGLNRGPRWVYVIPREARRAIAPAMRTIVTKLHQAAVLHGRTWADGTRDAKLQLLGHYFDFTIPGTN